jgi:hypothetical protein
MAFFGHGHYWIDFAEVLPDFFGTFKEESNVAGIAL